MDLDERKEVYFDKYCSKCVACDKKRMKSLVAIAWKSL